jgi:hypothetical protein
MASGKKTMAAIQEQMERAAGKRQQPRAAAPVVAIRGLPETKQPSRAGKIHVGAYLPAGFRTSLLLTQAKTGRNAQELIAAALNELFRAHGVPVVDTGD